jgi:hypothetical protein
MGTEVMFELGNGYYSSDEDVRSRSMFIRFFSFG